MKNTLIAWLFCLPFASCTSPVTQMDLSGQWTVCLDSTDVGMDASFGGKLFDTSITLPGTKSVTWRNCVERFFPWYFRIR